MIYQTILIKVKYHMFRVEYLKIRNRQDNNTLDMARLLAKAKEELTSDQFSLFLNHKDIKLRESQVKKYVAIGKHATEGSRLARFLKTHNNAFEKAYQLAMIDNDRVRDELIELLNIKMLNDKKVIYAVELIKQGQPPFFAYNLAKTSKQIPKPQKRTKPPSKKYQTLVKALISRVRELEQQLVL